MLIQRLMQENKEMKMQLQRIQSNDESSEFEKGGPQSYQPFDASSVTEERKISE